jgi:uncharacterized protein
MKIELEDIRTYAKRVAQRFKPERIILFGSYAYGAPNEASDVDLLIIMPRVKRGVYKAIEIQCKTPPPFPADILVRSRKTIRDRVALGDSFLREIMNKGRVLYETVD